MAGAVLIMAQIYINLLGCTEGQFLSFLITGFYLNKVMQYFLETTLFFQMAQSNMACGAVLFMSVFNLMQLGGFFNLMAMVLVVADLLVGTNVFVYVHEKEMKEEIEQVCKLFDYQAYRVQENEVALIPAEEKFERI